MASCRRLLIGSAAAALILAGGLVAAERRHGDARSGATIGKNALPMPSKPTTYRLGLDGVAAIVPTTPAAVHASPDGRYRVEPGTPGLVLVDARTGARRRLTGVDYPDRAYWGPNGLLAFADRSAGLTELVVLDPATGARRVVASHVCGDAVIDPWSPDGRSLAIPVSPPRSGCNGNGGSELAVASVDGGMRRLTKPRSWPVTWSTDGSGVLVAMDDGSYGTSRLVDSRTGTTSPVLRSVGSLAEGSWSHERRFFAALAVDPAQQAQVVVIVDRALRRIVRSMLFGSRFAWAPRAQRLAAAGDADVRVIDAQTGRNAAVIPAHTPYGLAVESLEWSRDGRSIVIVAIPSPGRD